MTTQNNPEVAQKDIPQIIHLTEVVSTNLSIREYVEAQSLPEGSVIWADYQNAGRGQKGNSWESEAMKNLTFSIVLYPEIIPAREQFIISQITALSVKKTLEKYVDEITIKWPNDIYWRDKKICGMLVENDLSGTSIYCSIIGIGININQEVFRSKAPNPISLIQITGKKHHRETVLDVFLSYFYSFYLLLLQEKQDEIREAYNNALYRKDNYHRYKDDKGVFEAIIAGIEPSGHLLLQLQDSSIRRYAFKEVSFIPDNDYFCRR